MFVKTWLLHTQKIYPISTVTVLSNGQKSLFAEHYDVAVKLTFDLPPPNSIQSYPFVHFNISDIAPKIYLTREIICYEKG